MSWNQFDLSPSNPSASGIAAVSRESTTMEMWWIEADGSVQGASWYDGKGWGRYQLAAPGSAAYGNCIAAVSRRQDTMEVYWIGKDGSVQHAYWYDNGQDWQHTSRAPAGSAAPNSCLTAVSRIPTSIELWWVGPDGSIQDAYFYEGSAWQRFTLAPAGSAWIGTGVAAASRQSNTMEVFWFGSDGSVQNAHWYDGTGWSSFALAPAGSADKTCIPAVVSRMPNALELFWVGPDGSVQDAYYYDGQPWKRFVLAPANNARTSCQIHAVSRLPYTMEVLWTGPAGSVEDAYFYEASGWNRFTQAPAGSVGVSSSLAGVSRIPNSLEFWWQSGHSVRDAYWYGSPQTVTGNASIVTPAGTSLGGQVAFTLCDDGTYTTVFHMHDSGIPDYDFQVRAVWVAPSGMTFVAAHNGQVEGSNLNPFSNPSRSYDATDAGYNEYIFKNWADVRNGNLQVSKDYAPTGLIGIVDEVAKAVLDATATVGGAEIGLVIGLGKDVLQIFPSLGIGETFGLFAGVIVFASTGGGILLAVVAGVAVGAVTDALIKQRDMTGPERTFADAVFQGSLDFDRVKLTNISGLGGRAFTFPGVDGKYYYVNIGGDAFESPLTYSTPKGAYPTQGELLIHELTHAWQCQHTSFTPGLVCNGIVNQANYQVGEDVYKYPAPGPAWSSFNLEAQGAIVDQWFGGVPLTPGGSRNHMDPNDPYFRYIKDNIRANQTL